MTRIKRSHLANSGANLMEAWRDSLIFGKAKRLRSHPKRYHLLVQAALQKMGLRYRHQLTAFNPHHKPGGKYDAGYQIIDYIVLDGRFAILVMNPKNMQKDHERKAWEAKLKLLDERNIPVLILDHNKTGSDYFGSILLFHHRITRPSGADRWEEKADES